LLDPKWWVSRTSWQPAMVAHMIRLRCS
jgi:hypothetical protein